MAKLVIGNDKTVAVPAIVKEVPVPMGKYQLLQRVKDDSNNEIGTVCGFHIDANSVEYAVVCLDAQYRLASGQITSSTSAGITDLPIYNNMFAYGAKETATFNCDKILAQCTTSGWTSAAISHCRSKTFTIGGVLYEGQLPSIMETLKILENREAINANDPTANTYPSLIIGNNMVGSSTAHSNANIWGIDKNQNGHTYALGRAGSYFTMPVLEIPNALS